MEGAVRSFKRREETPPLQGRAVAPHGDVYTPGRTSIFLGLPSALPKRSERSTEEEEAGEWGLDDEEGELDVG